MYWGPELVAIYNEAYVPLAGKKHPKLMGQSYKEAWSEIWHLVEQAFADAIQTGKATMKVWMYTYQHIFDTDRFAGGRLSSHKALWL